MKCERITIKEEFVLDAFFHIFTLCLILGLFFFFVVSKLERENLQSEMENKEIELLRRNGDSSMNPIDDVKTILDFFKD